MIFVLVASPFQHAFNLHQTVPDHGHGSVALTGASSNNVISLMRARFIDFPKMLLRDLKKFDNFAYVLGISSFLYRKIGTFQSY